MCWPLGFCSALCRNMLAICRGPRQPTCRPSGAKTASISASHEPIHLCLPFPYGIQRLAPDLPAENKGKVVLIVYTVCVQMEEHFGPRDCRYPRAYYTFDLWQCFEEPRVLGATAARWYRAVDGDAPQLVWGGSGFRIARCRCSGR